MIGFKDKRWFKVGDAYAIADLRGQVHLPRPAALDDLRRVGQRPEDWRVPFPGREGQAMRFEIIWPERRFVSEDQIRIWYSDAVANGEAEELDLNDPEDMAQELSRIGHITLGKGR